MGAIRSFGHQRGSSIVNQCLYALSRQSSMNFGSFFLADIVRTTSSLRPRGTVSASISVTKPYLYSRLASSSIVRVAVVISSNLLPISPCHRAVPELLSGNRKTAGDHHRLNVDSIRGQRSQGNERG